MDEVGDITDYVQERVGNDASIILGSGTDERLTDEVGVTIIATGFASGHIIQKQDGKPVKKQVTRYNMDENGNVSDEQPISLIEDDEKADDEQIRVFDFDALEREKERQIEWLYGQDNIEPDEKRDTDDNMVSWAIDSNKKDAGTLLDPASAKNLTPEEMGDEKLIDEMENIPAYKRRNINIGKQSPKETRKKGDPERKVSRFSLSEGRDGTRLSDDNPWLHDNVD